MQFWNGCQGFFGGIY